MTWRMCRRAKTRMTQVRLNLPTFYPSPSRSQQWRSPECRSSAHFSAFSACSLKLWLIKCEKYRVGKPFFQRFFFPPTLLRLARQRISRSFPSVRANKTLQCVIRIVIGIHNYVELLPSLLLSDYNISPSWSKNCTQLRHTVCWVTGIPSPLHASND